MRLTKLHASGFKLQAISYQLSGARVNESEARIAKPQRYGHPVRRRRARGIRVSVRRIDWRCSSFVWRVSVELGRSHASGEIGLAPARRDPARQEEQRTYIARG